jgi:ribosome-interacting GTPase 1
VLDDASLDGFKEAVWRLTGLVCISLRRPKDVGGEPLALRPPATVADVAHTVHHELASRLRGARVWGPSARFAGQRVGVMHELEDGDAVELLG